MLSSSVVRRSSSSSTVRSSPVPSVARASRIFKSGVLKPLHLNQVRVYNNKSKEEDKEEELEQVKKYRGVKKRKNHYLKKKKKSIGISMTVLDNIRHSLRLKLLLLR